MPAAAETRCGRLPTLFFRQGFASRRKTARHLCSTVTEAGCTTADVELLERPLSRKLTSRNVIGEVPALSALKSRTTTVPAASAGRVVCDSPCSRALACAGVFSAQCGGRACFIARRNPVTMTGVRARHHRRFAVNEEIPDSDRCFRVGCDRDHIASAAHNGEERGRRVVAKRSTRRFTERCAALPSPLAGAGSHAGAAIDAAPGVRRCRRDWWRRRTERSVPVAVDATAGRGEFGVPGEAVCCGSGCEPALLHSHTDTPMSRNQDQYGAESEHSGLRDFAVDRSKNIAPWRSLPKTRQTGCRRAGCLRFEVDSCNKTTECIDFGSVVLIILRRCYRYLLVVQI